MSSYRLIQFPAFEFRHSLYGLKDVLVDGRVL